MISDHPKGSRADSPNSCIAALRIAPLSDTLRDRWYTTALGNGIPFLRWWVDWFTTHCSQIPLFVLCQTRRDCTAIRQMLSGQPATVVESPHYHPAVALDKLACDIRATTIAVLHPLYVFAPATLLPAAYSHHHRCRNNFTKVVGLPANVAPYFIDQTLLQALTSLEIPGLPTEPAAAVNVLSRFSQATTEPLPIEINSTEFDVRNALQIDTRSVPQTMAFSTPADWAFGARIAQHMMGRSGSDESLESLARWKQQLLQLHERHSEQMALRAESYPRHVFAASSKRNRILFVCPASAFSGAEQSLCQMINELGHLHYDLSALVSLEGLLTESLRKAGVAVHCVQDAFDRSAVVDCVRVLEHVRTVAPSLVHTNGPAGIGVLLAAKLLGLPLVHHVRNHDLEGHQEYLRYADAVIAVSETVRREACRFEVHPSRVHVIYNEVDCDHFHPGAVGRDAARSILGISGDAAVVLLIARFAPNKRHDVLVEATRMLKPEMPLLTVLIAGEVYGSGEYHSHVQMLIEKHDLSATIRMIGFVEDPRVLFDASDVLVLCSEQEGLGRSVVEAMAMGVVPIVSGTSGAHEVIEHARTGFIVPTGDPQALAACLSRVLASPALRDEIGTHARAFAMANLSAERSACATSAVYEQVIARAAHASARLYTEQPPAP